MVRSNLEYCASVWSPHTEKLKSKLEQVQRRAARYVTNRCHNTSSFSAMLNHLQLPTLEHRRVRHELFDQLVHSGKCHIDFPFPKL